MLKPSTWLSLAGALVLFVGSGCSNSPSEPNDAGSVADAGDAGATLGVDSGVVVETNSLSSPGYGQNPFVRQGLGVIEIYVTGGGLGGFTDVTVNPPFKAVLLSVSDSSVLVDVTVPHGAPLGPQTLTLTGTGSLTVSGVFTVTPISVSVSGSDANTGSSASPFRTVTKGLSVAGSGDIVSIGQGTYSAGEQWPVETINWPPTALSNIADGVIVQGASAAGTVLQGPGPDSGLPPSSGYSALVLQGSATVSNLSIEGFDRNILDVNGGTLTLQNVHVGTCPHDGIAVNNSRAVLSGDTRLHQCDWSAMGLTGASTVTANGIVVDHNGRTGVYADNGSTFTCTGCEFGFNGGYLDPCYNNDWRDANLYVVNANVNLTNTSMHDTSGMDILLYGYSLANLDTLTSRNTQQSPRLLADGGAPIYVDGGVVPRYCGWGLFNWNEGVMNVSNAALVNHDSYQIYVLSQYGLPVQMSVSNSSFIDGGYIGAYVTGNGATLSSTNNLFAQQASWQAYADSSAVISATGTTFTNGKSSGMYVTNGATVDLLNSTFQNHPSYDVEVFNGTFNATNSNFINSGGDGIDLLNGSTGNLVKSTVLNHAGYDVMVANSTFNSNNSNFVDGGSAGIEVQNWGYSFPSNVSMTGGFIGNHPNWDGVNLDWSSGATAVLNGVTISGAQSAASAYDGVVTIKNSTLENVQFYGVYAGTAGSIFEQDVTTTLGGGIDCWANAETDGGTFVIEQSTCNGGGGFIGTATGLSTNNPYWFISTPGQTINFLP